MGRVNQNKKVHVQERLVVMAEKVWHGIPRVEFEVRSAVGDVLTWKNKKTGLPDSWPRVVLGVETLSQPRQQMVVAMGAKDLESAEVSAKGFKIGGHYVGEIIGMRGFTGSRQLTCQDVTAIPQSR